MYNPTDDPTTCGQLMLPEQRGGKENKLGVVWLQLLQEDTVWMAQMSPSCLAPAVFFLDCRVHGKVRTLHPCGEATKCCSASSGHLLFLLLQKRWERGRRKKKAFSDTSLTEMNVTKHDSGHIRQKQTWFVLVQLSRRKLLRYILKMVGLFVCAVWFHRTTTEHGAQVQTSLSNLWPSNSLWTEGLGRWI